METRDNGTIESGPTMESTALAPNCDPSLIRGIGGLSKDLFLLLAALPNDVGEGGVAANAVRGGIAAPAQIDALGLRARGGALETGRTLLLLSIPGDTSQPLDRVELRLGDLPVTLPPSRLIPSRDGLKKLVLEHLAGRGAEERAAVMEFVATATWRDGGPRRKNGPSRTLRTIREALRERFPRSRIAKEIPRGLHIDSLLRVDERSFYVRGWLRDQDAPIRFLRTISPEGCQADLLSNIYFHARPDVDQFYGGPPQRGGRGSGFIAFFEVASPSLLSDGWVFQLENEWGEPLESTASITEIDPGGVRTAILEDLAHASPPEHQLLHNHTFPAISKLQTKDGETVEIESVRRYGEPNGEPQVSLVIPLYRRIDLIETQLAQFFRDPEILESDLLYVLDSPELSDQLERLAPQLYELYRVPFRVVVLQRNSGFSAANNVGAAMTRGRLLLFMNSDVFPERPGWLGTLRRHYDSTPGIGALGPKLLYEDDSLQHAGIYFRRKTYSAVWENMHYFKGLHGSLAAANVERQVPAVTGACMLISRDLYQETGGFRGCYLQGDFEDTDLCLRLIELGRQNWYLPSVQLYHLEAQSYPTALRRLFKRYNEWLHSHLWNDVIERLMEEARIADLQQRQPPRLMLAGNAR